LAEHAREATPYGMQRLLSQAVWDADGVRDAIRTFVLQQVGHYRRHRRNGLFETRVPH